MVGLKVNSLKERELSTEHVKRRAIPQHRLLRSKEQNFEHKVVKMKKNSQQKRLAEEDISLYKRGRYDDPTRF
jgi:alkylated DNA nucleotide flippase Atl1